MMKRFVLFIAILSLVGCSRKTIDQYEGHFKEEYSGKIIVDSTTLVKFLAENRNTVTSRVDSVFIRDSIRIIEHEDGSVETYRERNTEKLANYVTADMVEKMIASIESKSKTEADTISIIQQDTIYRYKEKGISKIQQGVNVIGITGLLVVVLAIIFAFVWRYRH